MKKRRQSLAMVLMFLIFLGVGLLCGMALAPVLQEGSVLLRIVLLLVLVYGAMLLQIALHEAGHLLFGLLTGYRFCSYRLFSLMWMKQDGKIRFRRYSLAGTGGQCLMDPPDYRKGSFPAALYNLGGPLINAISALVFGLLAWALREQVIWSAILQILAVIGLGFALTNGIPMENGSLANDGKNALSLGSHPAAKRAFWIQMKIGAEVNRGLRLQEMPEAWFRVPADAELDNPLISALGVFAANRLMDRHRFREADDLMAHLLDAAPNMIGIYRALLICDRIYCEVLGENRREVVEGYLTKQQLKMMKALRNLPSVLRTQYACALLSEHNPEQAGKLRRTFEKLEKTYPYGAELAGERELLELAENR